MAAMEDFQRSLELKKNQPIAMLYKGLTFFHRGMLKVLFPLKHMGVATVTCGGDVSPPHVTVVSNVVFHKEIK